MFYLTCTMISSVDLACCGVSHAQDWVSWECGTNCYIYVLGVFTSKPYSKPLECNVVYIQITIPSLAPSVTSKQDMALYNLIGRWRCSVVSRNVPLLQVYHRNLIFRQGFD